MSLTREAFNRGFDRLQNAFEHPVKQATALMYYEQFERVAEPDFNAAVNVLLVDERTFPRIATLKEAIERAEAARKKSTPRGHDPEERACVGACYLGVVSYQDAEKRWYAGRCAVCQRGPIRYPLVDPHTGQRVG